MRVQDREGHARMEQLSFSYRCSGRRVESSAAYAIAGVVSSGNCEVLIEKGEDSASCPVAVSTSRPGFEKTWNAVLGNFLFDYDLSGYRILINDAGAVPAVVNLRLHQAVEDLMGYRV